MSGRSVQLALSVPVALAVGVGVFFLTCMVEPAQHATLNFGTEYARMATDPFGLIGSFPHRILSPLLAHLLGLAGDRYWMFAHGVTALMIAVVFAAARRHNASFWQSLTLTTVIGFTGTVQIYKGHVGYPDPLTFLLLTASLMALERPLVFWALMLLDVLHHEQIFFFWPWLLYRRRVAGARLWHDLLGVAAVAGAYVGWRYYVGAHAVNEKLTLDHYLGLTYFPVGTLGLASLNVVSTYIWFGVLPVLVCWHAFVDGFRRAGFGILLYVLSIFAIFAVAHDVYRFTCFLFVPVFFAGLRLLRERDGGLILAHLGVATVAAVVLQRQVFVDVAGEVMKHLPTPVPSIVPEVIPAMWGTFAWYGGALLATLVVGWAWARRTRTPNEPVAPPDAAPPLGADDVGDLHPNPDEAITRLSLPLESEREPPQQ